MAIALPKYVKIKDRYCIGYFGEDSSVIKELLLVRQQIENSFPGLQFYIVCSEHLIIKDDKVLSYGDFLDRKNEFPYFRVLNGENIVQKLMEESGLVYNYKHRGQNEQGV